MSREHLMFFEAARENQVKNIVFISSESVSDPQGIYGWTKVLSEQIAQRYFDQAKFNVLTLRPRAFIPYWNTDVYASFVEWAKWYWKGAVHINDVAEAVLKGIEFLAIQKSPQHWILPVDGAYDYSEYDLLNWDTKGVGETFKKYYGKFFDLARKFDLDVSLKPTTQNISETTRLLGYEPKYSLMNLLQELAQYGEKGPPVKLD